MSNHELIRVRDVMAATYIIVDGACRTANF